MTTKEHNSASFEDLEATQLVSLDDIQELEQLQLAHAPEPAQPRRASVAPGTILGLVFLGLVLAAVLLAMFLTRAGGHF